MTRFGWFAFVGLLGCTPADAALVKGAEKVVCALAPVISGNVEVGKVCQDVLPFFDALVSERLGARPAVAGVVANESACTRVTLHEIDSRRDEREYVCAEAFPREAVTKVLAARGAR